MIMEYKKCTAKDNIYIKIEKFPTIQEKLLSQFLRGEYISRKI